MKRTSYPVKKIKKSLNLSGRKARTDLHRSGLVLIQYHHFLYFQISYQSIESSDPGINVPGPRRTVSKLRNETYHMFSGLHPGTTYLVSVRARTAKGFGQTALTEITTNISGESLHWLLCVCLHVRKRFSLDWYLMMNSDFQWLWQDKSKEKKNMFFFF